jgi:outer membrane protein OmpA-like peptidoglycan-associated protein
MALTRFCAGDRVRAMGTAAQLTKKDAARRKTRRTIAAIVVLLILALLAWLLLGRKPPPPPLAEFGAPLAMAKIALCPGLQIVTAISQPDGDYESIKTIEAVDAEGVHIRYSSEDRVGDVFADDYGKMQRMTVTRTVRPEDLKTGAFYAQRWFKDMPHIIPGATALGASQRILEELRAGGAPTIAVSNAYSGEPPADPTVRPNIYDYVSEAPLTRIASEPFIVLVDDRLVALPTLSARAAFITEAAEFTFLDDGENPLTLAFRIGISPEATRPPETLTLTKIARTCDGVSASAAPERDMARQLAADRRIALYDIHFAFKSAELRDESGPRLAEIAAMLAANPSWRLRIEVHTDDTMPPAEALALSTQRAEAMKTALTTQHGLDPARIEPTGQGSTHPRAPTTTPESRARNRRVELVLL